MLHKWAVAEFYAFRVRPKFVVIRIISFFGLQVSVEWFLRGRIRIIHSFHLFSVDVSSLEQDSSSGLVIQRRGKLIVINMVRDDS